METRVINSSVAVELGGEDRPLFNSGMHPRAVRAEMVEVFYEPDAWVIVFGLEVKEDGTPDTIRGRRSWSRWTEEPCPDWLEQLIEQYRPQDLEA